MSISNSSVNNQDCSGQQILNDSISHIQARDSDLSAWRLSESSIVSLRMDTCSFNNTWADTCRWKLLRLDHSLARQGTFSNCVFDEFLVVNSFLTAGRFSGCRLTGTVSELSAFALSSFENTCLVRSRMSEVSFIATIWKNCEFRDEDYFFVRFPSSLFINTSFIDCNLRKVIFRWAFFINCRFQACQLPEAVFHNAHFVDTDFPKTDIHQAANLEGVRGLDL